MVLLDEDQDGDEFFDALSDFDAEDTTPQLENGVRDLSDFSAQPVVGPTPSTIDPSLQIHEAAFNNNIAVLETLLQHLTAPDAQYLDNHGNNVLHIATMRGNHDAVRAILSHNFPVTTKSRRGWTAADEALALGDRDLVEMLVRAAYHQQRADMKDRRKLLLRSLHDLPDYSMQLKWELGSPVPGVGMLLRRVAPHDVYHIWKRGSCVRIDGSLTGVDSKSDSLLPQYKRGHFSILVDGTGDKEQVFYVNRKKKTFIDLTADTKALKTATNEDDLISAEVDSMMIHATTGVDKTKFKAGDVKFSPIKGWLGGDLKEKVEQWNTTVYEATAQMVQFTKTKRSITVPREATFQDYLDMHFPEDAVVETAVSPFNPNTYADEMGHEDGAAEPRPDKKSDKKVRKISGRCWMAEKFPMSLKQLLPLLDIMGEANKHMRKVAKFMNKYGNMNMFPVKVQVPLVFTLHVLLAFKHFRDLNKDENRDDFYAIPADYTKKALKDALDKLEAAHGVPPEEPQQIHLDIDGNVIVDDSPGLGGTAAAGGRAQQSHVSTPDAVAPPTPTQSDAADKPAAGGTGAGMASRHRTSRVTWGSDDGERP